MLAPNEIIARHQRLTNHRIKVKFCAQAEVAELADALRSGRSESSLVRVQIPPSAHNPRIQRGFSFLGEVRQHILESLQGMCQQEDYLA